MAFSRRKSFRKKTTSKRRTFKRKTVRKGGLKKLVQREIARNVEDKSVQTYNLGLALTSSNAAAFNTNNIIQVSPSAIALPVNQGTGQGARVGNRIKIKKVMFKGTLVPQAYNATTNVLAVPLQVKMFLFYDKLAAPNTIPAIYSDFFQFGSTTTSLHNDLVDMWSPVNTDKYTVVKTKIFKLGFADNIGSGNAIGNQYFANNDFKMNCNFSIDLTPHLIKHVKYNDNSSDPSTRSLFCAFVCSRADGGGYGSTQIPAGVQYMLDMKYEDA